MQGERMTKYRQYKSSPMASYFNRFVAAILVASGLVSGTATLSPALAQIITFGGPAAIMINSGNVPPVAREISQDLLTGKRPG